MSVHFLNNMRNILFIFSLVISFSLNAQFFSERNIIIPMTGLDYQYGVTPLGEEGIVLFHETTNLENRFKRKWEVIVLDNELNIQWTSAFESDMNYVISGIKPYKDYIYLMFQDTNVPLSNIFFLRFKLDDNQFQFFQISELLPREIIGFEVLGNSLFVIGINENRPAILKYKYGDPRPTVLKGLFDEKNEILHSEVDEDHEFVQIITKMKKKGEESVILVKQFDETGAIVRDLLIESPKGYHMLNALANTDQEGNTSIIGTYSYNKSRLSNGIFSTVFAEGQHNELYYYDYGNLHNYFNYLVVPDEIEKAKQKYGVNKARSVKVNLVPRMIHTEDSETIFLAEAIQISEKYSNTYGFLWQQEYTTYSHALILGVDPEGKIKWDNSFSLNNQTSFASYQQTFLGPIDSGRIIFYTDGFSIHYKIFDGIEDVISNDVFLIDRFKNSAAGAGMDKFGNILHWYGNTYLAFGENVLYGDQQNINKSFYLNKITLGANPNQ